MRSVTLELDDSGVVIKLLSAVEGAGKAFGDALASSVEGASGSVCAAEEGNASTKARGARTTGAMRLKKRNKE